MIFLFPRWDMLVSWRVYYCEVDSLVCCGWSFRSAQLLGYDFSPKKTEESQRKNPTPRKDWLLKLGDFSPPPPKKKKDPCKASFTHFTFAITLLYFWHLWSSWSFGLALQTLILIVCYLHAVVIKTKRLELTEKQGSFVPRDCWRCIFLFVFLRVSQNDGFQLDPKSPSTMTTLLVFWKSTFRHVGLWCCHAAKMYCCGFWKKLPPHNSETNIGESKWVFPKIGGKTPKIDGENNGKTPMKNGMIWGENPLFSVQHPNPHTMGSIQPMGIFHGDFHVKKNPERRGAN